MITSTTATPPSTKERWTTYCILLLELYIILCPLLPITAAVCTFDDLVYHYTQSTAFYCYCCLLLLLSAHCYLSTAAAVVCSLSTAAYCHCCLCIGRPFCTIILYPLLSIATAVYCWLHVCCLSNASVVCTSDDQH